MEFIENGVGFMALNFSEDICGKKKF